MSKVIGMILTYNCAELVADTYRGLPEGIFDQVIIVDDASSDSILLVAEALGIPAYTHGHLGYGGNVKFGLRQALAFGADCIVEIHGDGQYATSAVAPALEKVHQGSHFVMGSRFLNGGQAPA
jgi:glycosyltransferase involved in cell wall biosynthesis